MADTARTDTRLAEVRELSTQFTNLVSAAPTHSIGLEALLLAYIAMARLHTCCTQEAANAAMRVSMLLAREAASPPTNHSVH